MKIGQALLFLVSQLDKEHPSTQPRAAQKDQECGEAVVETQGDVVVTALRAVVAHVAIDDLVDAATFS